jgi:uncharacterized membrane protein
MINVTLYTRQNCHLCDVAKADLDSLQHEHPHKLFMIDIDEDESLRQAFGELVPVIEVGPYRKEAPFSRQDLIITLKAAQDRAGQLEKIGDARYAKQKARARTLTRADRLSFWFTNHYMLVFNLLVFLYVGIPFTAPALMNAGITGPARIIYTAYGAVCHQFAFRSWFLFGEQAAYPRAAAQVEGYLSYGQATGLNEEDVFQARSYLGDEGVGYKVAFCERDVAIYGGILFFGVLFTLTGRRLPSLPWYFWILLGILPIALDGVSQLLSQPPLNLWAYRESTPFLRTLTGFLFGFSTAWFGYPQVEEAMRDTRKILTVKFSRIKQKLT